ncbi:MAG: DEAD/DEAH box helicase, partial [Candidatus Saccharimonadales bacterium]
MAAANLAPTEPTKPQPFKARGLPVLTTDQAEAYRRMDQSDTYLLHGRTGSGKTRIYLELAQAALSAGQSVIVLTPEISLTTQLESQFKGSFGDSVVVIHSTLTVKQRAKRWTSLLMAERPLIVIGPRSVIFSPLSNLGLIIVDEEHEPAYKQEQAPYYVTSRVASQLRTIHGAKLVLGSATPLVSDYYLAETRQKSIIRLAKLAQGDS